jgi:uncharacterized SAM-binding protein YcdF (DUF218 family)
MLHAVLTAVIVPPANLVWVCLLGVWVGRRRRAVGQTIAASALAGLIVLGLPITGKLLLLSLEDRAAPTADNGVRPAAIVILGGDDVHAAENNGRLRPGPLSLERMLAGAALHRRTSLPVLVTGGPLIPGDEPVAIPMVRTLEADLATPVRWVEPSASDTWQNARASAAMLRADGITSLYVVTHAWHMRRSLLAFAGLGVAVTAAPVRIDELAPVSPADFVPQATGWMTSYLALHEWIGCVYYALRRNIG